MQYIYIKDSNGNTNIWKIENEIKGEYFISSRSTTANILVRDCFVKKGSTLLLSNVVLDVLDSVIDVESEAKYEEYLCNLNKKVKNPFEKIDLGYLEDSIERRHIWGYVKALEIE
jgi:hypothetical protein